MQLTIVSHSPNSLFATGISDIILQIGYKINFVSLERISHTSVSQIFIFSFEEFKLFRERFSLEHFEGDRFVIVGDRIDPFLVFNNLSVPENTIKAIISPYFLQEQLPVALKSIDGRGMFVGVEFEEDRYGFLTFFLELYEDTQKYLPDLEEREKQILSASLVSTKLSDISSACEMSNSSLYRSLEHLRKKLQCRSTQELFFLARIIQPHLKDSFSAAA